MRLNLLRPAFIGSLFLVCLAEVGSPTKAAAQDVGSAPTDRHDDDRSLDLGLLGLVGLAGLLGLRRRDSKDVSRTASNRSATSRA
jgi:MYXO-CTERM domain-containing protein